MMLFFFREKRAAARQPVYSIIHHSDLWTQAGADKNKCIELNNSSIYTQFPNETKSWTDIRLGFLFFFSWDI
jgi:hypothetical protein